MTEYDEDDYLMLSGLQHFIFCRRQWALIHVEQQWAENYQTTSGELMHKRAHNDELWEYKGNVLSVRGLRIASKKLGLHGQCDIVEFHQSDKGIHLAGRNGEWIVVPVEYKRGLPKEGIEDKIQLCAQALCLEEMLLTQIEKGYLYYGESHRRQEVAIDLELREEVYKAITEMHELMKRGYTPKVKQSKKCTACSMKDLCMPQLNSRQSVKAYIRGCIGAKEEE